MAKKFKAPTTDGHFGKRKSNGQLVLISNIAKDKSIRHSGIASESAAKRYIRNNLIDAFDLFEVPEEYRTELFDSILAFGKKKLTESGFSKCIPAAEKEARAFFDSTPDTVVSEEETSDGTPDIMVFEEETSVDDATTDDATTDDSEETAPEPASEPLPAPSDTTDTTDTTDTESTDEEEPASSDSDTDSSSSDDEPAEDTSDEESSDGKDKASKKKKTKKNKSPWIKVACLAIGCIIGFAIAFLVFNGKYTNDHFTYDHGNSSAGENVVVYSCQKYLLSDYGAKGTITVTRNSDKVVGRSATLLMDSTIYTDENGVQWLRYTSTTADVAVEIIAPIFPEGATSAKKDWQETVEKRNRQFGVVDVSWNGDQCIVTLTHVSRTYDLEMN